MLLAVSPSGRLKWKYELSEGTQSSPTIAADGIVYIGSDDHCVYAISLHDGSLKGLFKTEGKISSSPAIGSNGVVRRVIVSSMRVKSDRVYMCSALMRRAVCVRV